MEALVNEWLYLSLGFSISMVFFNFYEEHLRAGVVLGIEISSNVVESEDLNHDDVVDINDIQNIVNLVVGE
jgi:hypothetical protein